MKTIFWRCTLALIMCGSSLGALADWGTIFAEDFSEFESIYTTTTSFKGWTLDNCYKKKASDQALKITGYAITPSLSGLSGNAQLSFKCAKSSSSDFPFVLVVTIQGGGSFSENNPSETSVEVNVNSTVLSQESLQLYGGTQTSAIKFAAKNNIEPILIDDLVVTGNVENPAPDAPVFSVLEGYYNSAQTVTMSSETEDATIYYTTDGTEPTAESMVYENAIVVSATTTIKAVAIKDGRASNVTTEQYHIGNYLFAKAYTEEPNRYKVVGLNDVYSNIPVGEGNVVALTFRMSARTANKKLVLGVTENYVGGSKHIIQDCELNPTLNEWETQRFVVPIEHDGATLTLTFSDPSDNGNVLIDDVVLMNPPTITLNENADNAATLAAHEGQIVDVSTLRTLRANIWNTLCLPFEVTHELLNTTFGVPTTGMTTFSSYESGVMTFASVAENAVIPAGTPFLLKISQEQVNPTFRAVTIAATEPTAVTKGDVTFQGLFSRRALATDGTDLFLGTDNYLYQPAVGTNTMGGLRAYIHRANNNARISLSMDDGTVAVENHCDATRQPPVAYTLQGQRTAVVHGGVYIVDGRKVVVKK